MSVLNQSGEEQVECPLCMEPLEVDDLNFYPCTCGYQICRFCWHRIRTDENGLCPACRKAYSEDPADFKPLSQEEVAKLKAEKRQRDQQRKAKMSENRKHLASVRVVQRNLVFVVGLPMRLADAEVLKKHEYFGKFGKIHKVVINQSTAYAGSQGPSASAYVTYFKNDDALRAIQSVNNITIDGRLIKSSLGTTKYCSHFMKNQVCPKTDCMYLHDFGDTDASFTKEQMHAGKHQEYEKKLHDALLQRAQTNSTSSASTTVVESRSPVNTTPIVTTVKSSKDILLVTAASTTLSSTTNSTTNNTTTTTQMNNNGTNKENWPQLNVEKEKKDKDKAGKKVKTKVLIAEKKDKLICNGKNHDKLIKYETINRDESVTPPSLDADAALLVEALLPISSTVSKLAPIIDDNSSFFSLNSFQKISPEHQSDDDPAILSESSQSTSILTDALPNINTSEDWEAAFGFTDHSTEHLLELKQQQQQQQAQRDNVNGFVHHDSGFVNKGTNNYNGYYEKIHENIADVLNNKSNGFHFKQDNQQQQQQILNGMNGLDQNMSKFFMDFHKNNKELQLQQQQQQQSASYRNSYNCYSAVQSHTDRMLLLHQKQLEEQLMNISLNKNYGGGGAISPSASYHHTNGSASHQQQHYMNGEQHQYGVGGVKSANSRMAEDELDFDPFQETQKAFAELMANEQHQNHHNKLHNTVRSNGVIHSQAGHLPPPPPGFLQPTATHMNSFGSKILPFLNMSNNSQQINSSTQNNWPSSYNAQMQQHKNLNNTCNDWKVLDPAILSSSKYCPIREPFSQPQQHSGLPYATTATTSSTQHQQQQQQQIGGPLRSSAYDYTNNSFSNFTQQLQQPNFSNFSQLNSQSNLNWYTSEINSQISSPPGFRNSQTTKQQEC